MPRRKVRVLVSNKLEFLNHSFKGFHTRDETLVLFWKKYLYSLDIETTRAFFQNRFWPITDLFKFQSKNSFAHNITHVIVIIFCTVNFVSDKSIFVKGPSQRPITFSSPVAQPEVVHFLKFQLKAQFFLILNLKLRLQTPCSFRDMTESAKFTGIPINIFYVFSS